MSGFSPEWLALREPADHRSRNEAVGGALRERFGDRERISVLDLGCGTGSNLRALAPLLPARQEWRLLDHDPGLLAAARERIAAWADRAEDGPDGLTAEASGRLISVTFARVDLAGGAEAALKGAADLVTAAALLDLVSAAWIERFAEALARRRAVFFTALTYDGHETWSPPHPLDDAVLAAFLRHQEGDKGFGPAAGPAASRILAEALAARGYRVLTGQSAWELSRPADAALIGELAAGIAAAVRETGLVPADGLEGWLASRASGAACTIGHVDLLAVPDR
jgi:SAM-dependent methyltransferase